MRQRVTILGVVIDALNMEQAVAFMERSLDEQRPTYVSVCAVSTVIAAMDDPDTLRAVNGAGLVTADGMPLVWLTRAMGHPHARRVYGPDLMLALCDRSRTKGWRHFYLGGDIGVAEQLSTAMASRFQGLQTAGVFSPPFRSPTAQEDADLVRRINESGADIVWVGLGSPKQDHWMADHRSRLEAPLLVGVGAAFDFHTKRVAQAPRWMMSLGLEWLFRLTREPSRLWRRYLVGNPRFMVALVAQMMGARRFRSSHPRPGRRGESRDT